ncbi:hypothetical protein BUALT_Bualt01G0198700 [Buddleja alternifolia]|uniref:Uncharacterized protein n=1 Tax=Buddleja alternifolia TaxID=168488 RepID=A0AAV6Y9M5_9LAMI|nr:hypothetical protein BUALT_Bualt01G0198700 [Buddleja alternifolia]
MSTPAPPPSAHSKKPHFQFPKPSPMTHQIPTKSHSNPLCKTLIIVLLLLAIPLFPSQAPEFITQSIVTQFWEIIHLLFIGIAVSYGLFGTKTSQMGSEKNVRLMNDDDSHAYLSEISHLSSIFEDGFENLCGPEQDMVNSYANSDALFLGKDRCVVDEGRNVRSFVSKDGVESVCEGNVNQAWRSEYSKGESLVVVSNGKYFLDGGDDLKPLNLPVRSLRSKIVDNDKPQLRNRDGFSPKFDVKGDNDVKVVKIRGVTPVNLEKKFEEVSGKPSIPWRSRSGRMENGKKLSNSKAFVHYRPHSVGEFEFEHIKTRSHSGSMFSSSPELSSSKVENNDSELIFSVSNPKEGPFDEDGSFGGDKARPFGIGFSSETRDFECSPKNFGFRGKQDRVGKGKQAIESLDSDVKPLNLAKGLSRAKSVRTIKCSRYIADGKEKYPSQVDGTLGRTFKRGRGEEPENSPMNHQNQELDSIFPMPKPKPTLLEFHNEEKQDIDDGNITLSDGEETKSEVGKSPDEDDTRNNFDNDAELEGSEVDRKAGEFIAKFREQIRLQKMSSVKGHNGW